MTLRRALSIALALATTACAALSDDLRRAEASYDDARYRDALTWLTDLEDDAPAMDIEMRARFYYLRGMTEYRLRHRSEALHYLALAREVAGEQGIGLRSEWQQIMERTLAELMPTGMTHRPPEGADERGSSTSGGEAPANSVPPQRDEASRT